MTDIMPKFETTPAARLAHTPERLQDITFTTQKVTPEDSELWLAMGQLRAREYLKRDYISPDDLDEDGAEYDMYDDRAEHFIAVNDGGQVIGTARVINRANQGLELPGEKEFNQLLPEDAQEISRFIHDSSLSPNEGALVTLAMIRAILRLTKGVSDKVYAVLEHKLYRHIDHHIGIKLRTIAQPQSISHYNNTVNYLVEMSPQYVTSQIHERDERIYRETINRPALMESMAGKPFAPFFERDNATKGLGRVSLRDLTAPNPEQFERNRGFYSEREQQKLWNSTVAIAGVGGDGGQLAITLAQAGVRTFYLADPETFSVENLNRQAGADYSTIGHNKAEVIAKQLRALGATTHVYTEGVTEENVEDFMKHSDLVIDETEFTMPEIGAMIAKQARNYKLPVLMALNIGFGSYTTSFSPTGTTFEEYLGFDHPSISIEEIKEKAAQSPLPVDKWAPHIPSYANVEILRKVMDGELSAPSVAQGVQMAAADAGTQAVAHLLRDINPTWNKWISWAPVGDVMDVRDGRKRVHARSAHFATSVAIAALNTRRGKSHPTQN